MATRSKAADELIKSISGATQFDLKAFKKEKERIMQFATKEIAIKVESIRTILSEIKELVEATGAPFSIQDLHYELEKVESLHPDWQSSSYNC